MNYSIKKIKFENEFKICPECKYADGFHSMLKKENNITKWLFICPACHQVFDISMTTEPQTHGGPR